MSAKDKTISARTGLLFDNPFFGSLSLRLELKESPGCGTAYTNGEVLGYDPRFIESLTHAQTVALVAHEVMHCACGHPWRRGARNLRRANKAMDIAINPILIEAGFELPSGALTPETFGLPVGKSFEWYYDRLPDDGGGEQGKKPGKEKGKRKNPSSGSEPGGNGQAPCTDPLGEVRDAPTNPDANGDPPPTEADWQQATQQAANSARAQGKLPAELERFAAAAARPKIDWRSALRRFVQEHTRADYTWSKPNRRYLSSNLYLPALESEEMPGLAIGIDTSGSIDQVALSQARAELESIIAECSPAFVLVYYCDAEVARADRFERGEPIVWRPRGGGGTDFRPLFDALEKIVEPVACLIYFTDLAGTFPGSPPELPTLWVTESGQNAPFGETLGMERNEPPIAGASEWQQW